MRDEEVEVNEPGGHRTNADEESVALTKAYFAEKFVCEPFRFLWLG